MWGSLLTIYLLRGSHVRRQTSILFAFSWWIMLLNGRSVTPVNSIDLSLAYLLSSPCFFTWGMFFHLRNLAHLKTDRPINSIPRMRTLASMPVPWWPTQQQRGRSHKKKVSYVKSLFLFSSIALSLAMSDQTMKYTNLVNIPLAVINLPHHTCWHMGNTTYNASVFETCTQFNQWK